MVNAPAFKSDTKKITMTGPVDKVKAGRISEIYNCISIPSRNMCANLLLND